MSHLSAERLAALIDEQPTAAEISHLASCTTCSRERGAYEALAEMAKTSLTIGQPLTTWNTLAPRLKHDGIIDAGHVFGRRALVSRGWMQAAAAVMLVVGGAAAGRFSVRTPTGANTQVAQIGSSTPTFKDVSEAQAVATRSQNLYQASMAFIAANDPSGQPVATPAAIKTRLATLDRVSQIAGAALEDAPYDSVINTIYLNAQGQRQASMRQLNTGSIRLTNY